MDSVLAAGQVLGPSPDASEGGSFPTREEPVTESDLCYAMDSLRAEIDEKLQVLVPRPQRAVELDLRDAFEKQIDAVCARLGQEVARLDTELQALQHLQALGNSGKDTSWPPADSMEAQAMPRAPDTEVPGGLNRYPSVPSFGRSADPPSPLSVHSLHADASPDVPAEGATQPESEIVLEFPREVSGRSALSKVSASSAAEFPREPTTRSVIAAPPNVEDLLRQMRDLGRKVEGQDKMLDTVHEHMLRHGVTRPLGDEECTIKTPPSADSKGQAGKAPFDAELQTNAAVKACEEKAETRKRQVDSFHRIQLLHSSEYAFKESIWDVSIFLFEPSLGPAGSLHMSALLFLNVLAQAIFCGMIFFNFCTKPIGNDVHEELERWRTTVAHDLGYVDSFLGVSMVSRLCSRDGSLEVSGYQLDLLNSIRDYLSYEHSGNIWLFSGPAMSLLAIFIWLLVVLEEFQGAYKCIRAVAGLPAGSQSQLSVGENGSIVFDCITRRRLGFVGFVAIARVVVIVWLAVTGCLYLSYTLSMSDLLLNAMALKIVLNVDRFIFASLATYQARDLIANLRPLPARQKLHFRGLDLGSVLYLVVVLVAMACIKVLFIDGFVSNLRLADDAMCLGQVDFAYATNPSRNLTGIAQTKPFGSQIEGTGLLSALGVREAVDSPDLSAPGRYSYGFDSQTSIQQWSVWEPDQFVAWFQPHCIDLVDLDLVIQTYMSFVFSQELPAGIQSCSQLAPFCLRTPTSPAAAALASAASSICPVTCGCPDAFGGPLQILGLASGCPSTCATSAVRLQQLQAAECQDPNTSELNASPFWSRWADEAHQRFSDAAAAESMRERGCGFVQLVRQQTRGPNVTTVDPCSGRGWYRSLAPVCPQACGCDSDEESFLINLENCPSRCWELT